MPKTGSSDLFELIRSLSKAEKAAFKIYVRRGDTQSPMYLKLFDLVEKRKAYDEKKTIQLLKIEPIRFPELKHYLYNLVLKSLNDFYSGQSVKYKLREYLNIINILLERGLYDQCSKQIRKAKALAAKFEQHSFLIELHDFELTIFNATQYVGVEETRIKEINQQIETSLKLLKLSKDYSIATDLAFLRTYRSGGFRNINEAKAIIRLYDENNPKSKPSLPFDTMLTYYSFLDRYYHDMRDYKNGYEAMKKAIHLIESNPHQIAERPRSYAAAISNMINHLLHLRKFNEIPTYIKKLSEAKAPNERVKAFILFKVLSFEMQLCMQTGNFVKGILFVDQLEDIFSRKSALNAQTELLLYYYSVILCIGAEDYGKANYFLRKILDGNYSGIRVDVYCFAKILSLIVNFELNNRDYLEYAVKSVYRFLTKRKRLYKFESIVLEFIHRKIPKVRSIMDQTEAFGKLREKLLKLKNDPFEKEAFNYFDFISWLDSKIEGRSFAEVVRENAGGVNGC